MPRCCSSQVVSRAPCSSGRVSSAKTAKRPALLGGGEHHGQGGAVIRGGQAAGVAMRQDALAFADQLGPGPADRPAHLAILLLDGQGFVEQQIQPIRRACRARSDRRRGCSMRSMAQKRLTAVGRLVRR